MNKSKFLIIGSGRAGSHLLMSLIGSHPQVFTEKYELLLAENGDLFKKVPYSIKSLPSIIAKKISSKFRGEASREADLRKVINYVNARSDVVFRENPEVSIYGFNFFIRQLELPTIMSPIVSAQDFLANLEGYKIIHLYRKNIVRQGVSYFVKQAEKKIEGKFCESNKLHIDIGKLERRINQNLLKIVAQEDEISRRFNPLKISYEDDLLDASMHQRTLDKVFRFLEIDSYTVATKHKRRGADRIESYIENADQVRELIDKYCPEVERQYYSDIELEEKAPAEMARS